MPGLTSAKQVIHSEILQYVLPARAGSSLHHSQPRPTEGSVEAKKAKIRAPRGQGFHSHTVFLKIFQKLRFSEPKT
jgi:hypothetical protein